MGGASCHCIVMSEAHHSIIGINSGQDERQQSLRRPWMGTDTLHFSGDMLGIAGTSSVAAEGVLAHPTVCRGREVRSPALQEVAPCKMEGGGVIF